MSRVKINYNRLVKDNQQGENACVYARYSSHRQGENSIDGQLSAAKAYADAKGYTIVHEYIDRAMTGRNDNRDEFQKMLSDCAKKQFSVIIVWKVDRFGRNREEITFNKYRAKKHGVRVEYVAENLPDSPESVILESVLEGMAEYYSIQLAQNIRRGYRENARQCKYSGGRIPLGLKLDKERHFIIDPETAPIVRRIYDMYASGQTVTEIIEELNEEGIRTNMGKPFTKNSLRTVLKNEKYIGVYDFNNGEIRIENGIPAIIDKNTFRKVQELIKVNRRAPAAKWSHADYMLSGKLFCGTCGAQMVGECGTGKSGNRYNYYLCIDHKLRKGCKRKSIRQDVIEPYVLKRITELVLDDEVMEYIADSVYTYYQEMDQQKEKIQALNARIKKTENAINNLMAAIEAGVPVTEMTKNRLAELDSQRTALQTALTQTKIDGAFELTRDHIAFFLKQFQSFDYSDPKCQRRLIDVFVNSIYLTEDDLIINFNYGGETTTIKLSELGEITGNSESSVFGCCASASSQTRTYELAIYANVFALITRAPKR